MSQPSPPSPQGTLCSVQLPGVAQAISLSIPKTF